MTTNNKQQMLEQLRKKYENAAQKYGPKFFDIIQLESRITHLMQSGMSIDVFLQSEMDFFIKTEQLALKKKEELDKRAEFHKKVENIMAENEAKLEKYPSVFFDPSASNEIRRLVGAITQWISIYYPVIEQMLRGTTQWEKIGKLVGELERFYVPQEYTPTVLLRHYIEQLKTMGTHYREKIERKLLQTASLALYRLEAIIKDEVNYLENAPTNKTLQFTAQNAKLKDKWFMKSEDEALSEVLKYTSNVIDDFRLRDLAGHADKTENYKS